MTYYATSRISSVHLSVTLMDCGHIMEQKMEISRLQDRLESWLPACLVLPGL